MRASQAVSAATTLDVGAWIDAAFDVLAEGGIDAVRIDPLAKRLGVTRGSFYWHFKDREALHKAMLKQWRKWATYQIGDKIDRAAPDARERLRKNLALPTAGPRAKRAAAIEMAIRFWARRDEEAANAVRRIDHQRLRYYAKHFVDLGHGEEDARRRAYLFYATLMAQAIIVTDAATDVREHLASMVVD
ncbi:MAG TPA: TetR/AcrR family transcriptional regulator [Vitreimonas sp.]|jgi:AcrR family transcriptional regulator|nr:TetR/AcrR family transcriptional regulator [Vitreimonas sp.]